MRSVSVRACGAALPLLLVLFSAVPAFADDSDPATVEQQGRIHGPPGLTADDPPDTVVLQGRIHTPPGLTVQQEGRIQPPGGIAAEEEPPTVWELFLVWLAYRIHVPGG